MVPVERRLNPPDIIIKLQSVGRYTLTRIGRSYCQENKKTDLSDVYGFEIEE